MIRFKQPFDSFIKSGARYNIDSVYKDSYFMSDAEKFNKDLAILSLAGASCAYKNDSVDFYKKIRFDKFEASETWDEEPQENSIAYCFARKRIHGADVVAVSIRGFRYRAEWSGNVTVGEAGDHEGFSIASDTVYDALKKYLTFLRHAETLDNGLFKSRRRFGFACP